MQFLASFTISKYLDNAEGFEAWTSFQGAQIRDFYNTAAEKSLNPNDIPKSLVLSYIYELPFGRGKRYGNRMNSAANAILGGWQVSGVSAFKDGFPLGITAASNNDPGRPMRGSSRFWSRPRKKSSSGVATKKNVISNAADADDAEGIPP